MANTYKYLDPVGLIQVCAHIVQTYATKNELQEAIDTINRTKTAVSATNGTLTTNGWEASTYPNSTAMQTISITGVTTTNNVIVTYAPNSATDYLNAGILCQGQGEGTLTFTCDTIPTSAITVNILIFD